MKKLIMLTLCFALSAAVFTGCRRATNDMEQKMTEEDRRATTQMTTSDTQMTTPDVGNTIPDSGIMPSATEDPNGAGSSDGAGSANGGEGTNSAGGVQGDINGGMNGQGGSAAARSGSGR